MPLLRYPTTAQQEKLVDHYRHMAIDGYAQEGKTTPTFFDNVEIKIFKKQLKEAFDTYAITSVLDYGSGFTDYDQPFTKTDTLSIKAHLQVEEVRYYEPSRGIDQRIVSDAVICTDVLEHVFLSDLPNTVRELFELSGRLLFVNVACYPAKGRLPNGENVHTIVRSPEWWKGVFDTIAVEYPEVTVILYCSTAYQKGQCYKAWSGKEWLESTTFVIDK